MELCTQDTGPMVKINVAGEMVQTTMDTLNRYKGSKLSKMFDLEELGGKRKVF